ncbi:VanZ family protein [Bacillus sp. es.034]|uniref:VanZ family protein n=1 Tax=Bacillus sp. es.034 TaxID=1761763 RepID=UPI000BF40CB6|nr:VanZ family protein [Bacillus sp. es.034]PFG04632.1 VanZ like protein [Bacillus sp. es.034]
MRVLVAVCYGILIFILTCTKSLTNLVVEGHPVFQWNPHPDLMSFFTMSSFPFQSSAYIIQKAGHAAAFFFLGLVVHSVVKKALMGYLISSIIGLCTEIAQLFFSRTGCLLDVGYDVAGITIYFVAYFIIRALLYLPSSIRKSGVIKQ